ncbi:hypothetical protein [Edaphobacter aggregans]|uniref:hypothetical protein n=1 Tax=Edaphobacter aggregans TaxID=570835 RepID=UPI0012F8340C|nr:hypothetical protein [Edaphobacter aggregans]
MATQEHLNRECEGGLLFEDQCSPHGFLIDFKVSACHMFILLVHALAAIYAASQPFLHFVLPKSEINFVAIDKPMNGWCDV